MRDRRESRGVIDESKVFENGDRPIGDRECGRPVPDDLGAGQLFQEILRSLDVGAELIVREGSEQLVAVAVRRYLMTFGGDSPDQRWAPLGDPAKDEARGADPNVRHQ